MIPTLVSFKCEIRQINVRDVTMNGRQKHKRGNLTKHLNSLDNLKELPTAKKKFEAESTCVTMATPEGDYFLEN